MRAEIRESVLVADILERDGKTYDLDTIDDWLSKPDWKPPTKLEQN